MDKRIKLLKKKLLKEYNYLKEEDLKYLSFDHDRVVQKIISRSKISEEQLIEKMNALMDDLDKQNTTTN